MRGVRLRWAVQSVTSGPGFSCWPCVLGQGSRGNHASDALLAIPFQNSPDQLPGTASELVLVSQAVRRLRKPHCRSRRPLRAVA